MLLSAYYSLRELSKWDAAKAILRGKFIVINAYIMKKERSKIINLTSHLKELEKEQSRTKVADRRAKSYQKSRNEIGTRKANRKKINETKNWLLEKINQIEKPVATLNKRGLKQNYK